jgi:hypothetical protein
VLLEQNKLNRMAFEYLMALYLLRGQLDKFSQNFHRLDDFGYAEVPRLYEEALLLYVVRAQEPFDLRGREISPASRRRFEAFNEVLNRHRKDFRAAYGELARDFADTYFFYYLCQFMVGTK